MMNQMRLILAALARLGPQRLLLLAAAGLMVMTLLGVATYYLNRPAREVLYTGLETDDVNRIGAALSEAGIAYDVSVSGNAVLVDFGRTAEARMILAEKGLPKSDKSGYELFDQMGSLGLTSFMQQMTRVRALEGELGRTIQLLEGIRSARVHLGLKNEGTFRTKSDQPSASVVIKTSETAKQSLAGSVRQIVAAAIPGLKAEHVTVMTTDGEVLVSGGDPSGQEPDRKLELEIKIAEEARLSAERALIAIVGANNLRVSVTAKLNADRRQVTETQFDPDSRVERSVKTLRETNENQNSTGAEQVSVAQNIPQETASGASSDNSREKKERKEETANYEVNSKQLATESVGYTVERLSMAVLLNKRALAVQQDGSQDPAALAAHIQEIEQLVKSAIGFDSARGDSMRILATDFVTTDEPPAESMASPVMDTLMGHLGTIINAVSLIVGFVVVIMFGLRPAVQAIVNGPATQGRIGGATTATLSGSDREQADAALSKLQAVGQDTARSSAKDKLNKAVEGDVDRAAKVLKQWIDQPGQATR
jgi:flagellar M-ring protein FliF